MQLFGVNRIHKSRGILICKIFLLRKCQSGGGLGQISPSQPSWEAYVTDTATQLEPHFDLLRYAGNNYLPRATSTHCKSRKSCKQSMYYHPTTVSLLSLFSSAVNSLTYLSFSTAGHENITKWCVNASRSWLWLTACTSYFTGFSVLFTGLSP